jgi:hypothetical protein
MLEPDRTGLQKNHARKLPWLLVAMIVLLVAAGGAIVVLVTMKS